MRPERSKGSRENYASKSLTSGNVFGVESLNLFLQRIYTCREARYDRVYFTTQLKHFRSQNAHENAIVGNNTHALYTFPLRYFVIYLLVDNI
jgi:hypothetical protein